MSVGREIFLSLDLVTSGVCKRLHCSSKAHSDAFVVEASVVTVSGLQPVQIFEGTLFQPGQAPHADSDKGQAGGKAGSSRAERAAAYRRGQHAEEEVS